MAKYIKWLTAVFVLMLCFAATAVYAQTDITLKLDGKKIQTDVPPYLIQDRTMIPVRALFEDLGAVVQWDDSKKQAIIDYKDKVIVLTVNNTTAQVNGVSKKMDVPATIKNSRTLIPVRFVAENFGFGVEWDGKTSTVLLTSPVSKPPTQPNPPLREEDTSDSGYTYSHYLTDLVLEETDTYAKIVLKGAGKAVVSTMTLSNPDRLVFDFKDTRKAVTEEKFPAEISFLSAVRLGQTNPTTARAVLDLNAKTGYKIDHAKSGDDYMILVYATNIELPPEAILPEIQDPDSELLVFIDPGHGGSEVGTIGKYTENDVAKTIYEKKVNLQIALRVNELLEEKGVSTYMLRTEDEYINIYDRPKIANAKEADLYLSIHNNASTSTTVNGTQVYYSDSCPSFDKITNKELATLYYNAITEATGFRKAGVVDNNRYIVINQTDMPSLIIEVAFMSNAEDLEKLLQQEYIEASAQGIANATIQALNALK